MINELLALAGIQELATHASAVAKSTVKRCALFGVGAILGLGSLGFFVSAIWLELASQRGPVQAGLWVGGGLLGLAVVVMLIGMSIGRPPKLPPRQSSALADPAQLAMQLETAIQRHFKGRKGSGLQAAATAAFIGFILARMRR